MIVHLSWILAAWGVIATWRAYQTRDPDCVGTAAFFWLLAAIAWSADL